MKSIEVLHKNSLSNNNRKWCIFSHFDDKSKVAEYIYLYLKELVINGYDIVFVTTSEAIDTESIFFLKKLTHTIIQRQNIGYDFGSYKTGIDFLQTNKLNASTLLLTNDSVYGPIQHLDSIFRAASSYDIFGITDSYDKHYHLQSYFLLYNEIALHSHAFKDFWGSVEYISGSAHEIKSKIIHEYEIGGSQHFIKNGLKLGAMHPFTSLLREKIEQYVKNLDEIKNVPQSTPPTFKVSTNPTHDYWDNLLNNGCPFIKRELLLRNPSNADISNWPSLIRKMSEFDPSVIISNLLSKEGGIDFFYDRTTSSIQKHLKSDGTAKLPLLSDLEPWREKFNLPESAQFQFDEVAYLNKNLDVKQAIMTGDVASGLLHYLANGLNEGRQVTLKRHLTIN